MTQPSSGSGLFVIERILRDRDGIWRQIVEERDLRPLTVQMLTSSALSLAVYGAVLGLSYGWLQALSSLVKLPLLFLATLAICLPTLYLFNLVFGARLSLMQAVALIMVSITVTAVLTLAFAPISLFFLITAQSYSFYKLLNVAILLLTAVVGLRFLTVGMRALNDSRSREPATVDGPPPGGRAQPDPAAPVSPAVSPADAGTFDIAVPAGVPAPAVMSVPVGGQSDPFDQSTGQTFGQALPYGQQPGHPVAAGNGAPYRWQMPAPIPGRAALPARAPAPANMGLLYIWILLFGFVGTQLAWTLRPFFGSPGEPFGLFRHIGGTFYADVLRTIGHLLGG